MKRTLVGTAIALFALAPAMGWADCAYHDASKEAAVPVAKPEVAQASAASKAPAPVVAKASVTKQVRHARDNAVSSPSRADGTTVVAKTN
jgi:hypothetical protein